MLLVSKGVNRGLTPRAAPRRRSAKFVASRSAHEGHLDLKLLNHVSHEEVPTQDMLHALMVFRVVRDVSCALLISRYAARRGYHRACYIRNPPPIHYLTLRGNDHHQITHS